MLMIEFRIAVADAVVRAAAGGDLAMATRRGRSHLRMSSVTYRMCLLTIISAGRRQVGKLASGYAAGS